MSMDRTFYLGLSQALTSAGLPKGAINGIRIDNPSGSWLLVEPIHLYVPPYRSGWSAPVGNAFSISVTWVNSPSGSLSNVVMAAASKVIVYITSDQLPQDEGFPSGAGSQVATVPPALITVNNNITCQYVSDVPSQTTIIAPNVARKSIVRRLTAQWEAGVAFGIVHGTAVWFVSGNAVWFQTVSLETPYVSEIFEEGAFVVPAEGVFGLQVQALIDSQWVNLAGGSDILTVQVQYYSVNV